VNRDERRWMWRYARKRLRRFPKMVREELTAWRAFWQSYHAYRQLAPADAQPSLKHLYPALHDDTGVTVIEPIYFYQDAWAFEKIVQARPDRHVDVGSHHKTVALLSKVVPVTMVDLRPLSLPLDTLTFCEGSILDLPFEDASLPSVSSLCVAEHIGLGRYGDPLDPDGTVKALTELKRVVQPGGYLYLSLPLDVENRIYFNAHRAFTEDYLQGLFAPFVVVERRYIFGDTFTTEFRQGFGIGCYQLQAQTNGRIA
jgi:SAM-dependent methyltransferase